MGETSESGEWAAPDLIRGDEPGARSHCGQGHPASGRPLTLDGRGSGNYAWGWAQPSETAAPGKARLVLPALGPFPHHARVHRGFVRGADRKGFFAAALFQTQANETGRVQGDDDAAEFGAVAHEFFAAARHSSFKRRHGCVLLFAG